MTEQARAPQSDVGASQARLAKQALAAVPPRGR
eukprot:CAMPEP_0117564382 /NCGR_PEP_ID=MMETSP0784-20121206/55998_1 /TAXON_ID=39447 /ORGANISM="" /LENGTH=32 /DNA_ID= /DNA_START= /DNA_END= /DNA_ORIENTATION=